MSSSADAFTFSAVICAIWIEAIAGAMPRVRVTVTVPSFVIVSDGDSVMTEPLTDWIWKGTSSCVVFNPLGNCSCTVSRMVCPATGAA